MSARRARKRSPPRSPSKRVSQHFGLGVGQEALDFVDVKIEGDTRVFVEPTALRAIATPWAQECRSLVQNFFDAVITEIAAGRHDEAKDLLSYLREPNETHLGLSRGRPRGRGLGDALAEKVWEGLSKSRAARTGLLRHLEDTALMVAGIDKDIISDITTNIIREPLIRYTQHMCAFYGIGTSTVDSGALWDPVAEQWTNRFEKLPLDAHDQRLLLVPKSVVRQAPSFSASEYYSHYLLEHLKKEHLRTGSLVHVLRDGRRRVYKTELKRRYGTGKHAIVELTTKYPTVLDEYKRTKANNPRDPLGHDEVADATGSPAPDWEALWAAVESVAEGPDGATKYHRAVTHLLAALLYPAVAFPEIEFEVNDGRKRLDILFQNQARAGFFAWVADNFIAPYIVVECKNYSTDPANAELDQLIGRLNNRRGRVGILACRRVKNRARLTARCQDAARDDHGYLLVLDDADLRAMVDARISGSDGHEALLRRRFNDLMR